MTIAQVYSLIHTHYGLRGVFISELAKKLGISYADANILTIRAGFRRTKRVFDITLDDFSKDKSVLYIVNKIN